MRNILTICIVSAFLSLSGVSQGFAADTAVETVHGQVRTILDKKSISVFLLDKDGSILDIGNVNAQGGFQLDATVMDDPIYKELVKLNLRVRDKKGRQKDYKISENIDSFLDNKVKIGVLIFP